MCDIAYKSGSKPNKYNLGKHVPADSDDLFEFEPTCFPWESVFNCAICHKKTYVELLENIFFCNKN